ncbi:hypothetical protein LPJ56_001609 [Coemansia sp. RSA 2599]|nr:hypothetical protein LPJ56_001609 [Coemansia sp. RSA 2599]
MSQASRRQSLRLQEKAAVREKSSLEEPAASRQIGSSRARTEASSGVASGRVAKQRQPAGRVVASRYMSSSNASNTSNGNRKSEAVAKTGSTAWPSVRAISAAFDATPANARPLLRQSSAANSRTLALPRSDSAGSAAASRDAPTRPAARQPKAQAQTQASTRAARLATPAEEQTATDGGVHRHGAKACVAPAAVGRQASAEISSEYLQWLMIEARSKMAFDEAKAAAAEELGRLSVQAEEEKHRLVHEQRKLKLVRELVALDKWLAKNRAFLEDMREMVGTVSEPYTRFAKSLELTTRAMPISDVVFSDTDALVGDMQRYADAIQSHFPRESDHVKAAFAAADRLSRLGRLRREEQELLSECSRLREALEHGAALASSRQASERAI